jgi:hypothetical protein
MELHGSLVEDVSMDVKHFYTLKNSINIFFENMIDLRFLKEKAKKFTCGIFPR